MMSKRVGPIGGAVYITKTKHLLAPRGRRTKWRSSFLIYALFEEAFVFGRTGCAAA
jgi:hypothetical protein